MMPTSRAQVGKIIATLHDLGIRDRDERLRVLSALTYRKVPTTNDLSRSEASAVIEILLTAKERDDPAGYLRGLVETGEQRQAMHSGGA